MLKSEMTRCEGALIIIFRACSPSAAKPMLRMPSCSSPSRISIRLVDVSSTMSTLSCARMDMLYSLPGLFESREQIRGDVLQRRLLLDGPDVEGDLRHSVNDTAF